MGVGNFFGMLPEEMRNSRLYGVELDPVSGRIAKQLYPKADITVGGFETTDRRDFFDLAIGNVPFGQYQVNDKAYNKLNFSIHNYFFAKSLDQVRPGGVVAFVTSRYTMDAKDSTVRRYLAQRAELLGAIRLPNDAFKRMPVPRWYRTSFSCKSVTVRWTLHQSGPRPALSGFPQSRKTLWEKEERRSKRAFRRKAETSRRSPRRRRTAFPSTAISWTTQKWCWADRSR